MVALSACLQGGTWTGSAQELESGRGYKSSEVAESGMGSHFASHTIDCFPRARTWDPREFLVSHLGGLASRAAVRHVTRAGANIVPPNTSLMPSPPGTARHTAGGGGGRQATFCRYYSRELGKGVHGLGFQRVDGRRATRRSVSIPVAGFPNPASCLPARVSIEQDGGDS